MNTMTGAHGRPLPALRDLGFKWPEAQTLVEEQSKFWQELRALGREMQEVEASIPALRHQLQQQRADAIRGGSPDPTGEGLDQAETRLQELSERQGVLRLALEQSSEELHKVVNIHADAWREELGRHLDKSLGRLEKAIERVRDEARHLDEVQALATWLESPSSFGVSHASEGALDAVLDDARRRAYRVLPERVA